MNEQKFQQEEFQIDLLNKLERIARTLEAIACGIVPQQILAQEILKDYGSKR